MPANFIISIHYCFQNGDEEDGNEHFKIENERTGETLELYCQKLKHILVRHKKDDKTTLKIEWMEQLKRKSNTTIWMLV